MSTNENKRSEDESAKAKTAGKDAPPTADGAAGKPKAGLNYVFKIAPVDPKNSFDFEDVADK